MTLDIKAVAEQVLDAVEVAKQPPHVYKFTWSVENAEALARAYLAMLEEVETLRASGIHSCHDQCTKIECVLSRERDALLEKCAMLEDAHEKIKDGGVPLGVLGNVTDRMLAMVTLSSEALEKARMIK